MRAPFHPRQDGRSRERANHTTPSHPITPLCRKLRRKLYRAIATATKFATKFSFQAKPQLHARALLAYPLLLLGSGSAQTILAAELDPTKLPPSASVKVDFDRDIRPIFESRCYRCHGPERPKSGFRLDSRPAALKGGEHGVDLIPGQSAKSPLVYYVARLVEDMEMPPAGKGDPLTGQEVGLVRAWIDQGMPWSEASGPKSQTLFSVKPSLAWITVSGNKQEFREQIGLREGWSGGLSEFRLEERSQDGVKLDAEGRILGNQDDYQLKINLEKADLGFVRFGYEQFRRYYDDVGGFYQPLGTDPVRLGQDLHVDVDRAWFDVGLTLPNWPRVVVGYEYQLKDGSKSSLAWSDVSTAPLALAPDYVAIYPSAKELTEQTHILKLDVSHEIWGLRLEDNFRAEFYDLKSRRVEFGPVSAGSVPDNLTRYRETYDHTEAVNAFRLEKQFKDWLLLGGGYLYSRLDGDGGFTKESFLTPSFVPIAPLETSNPIVLQRESHVYNLSSLWGPWEGLSLSAALQNEWTHEEGAGQGLLQFMNPNQADAPHYYSSQRDFAILQEDVGLRYTGIPFTVLFADTRFRQEWIDHFERDAGSPDGTDFLRDTDATIDLKDFRGGFTVSPWSRASLEASYRHSLEQTDYDHRQDYSPPPYDPAFGLISGNGYPAFFRRRNIESDNVEARLILHPASWIKTTLKYQLVAADYRTVTDPSVLIGDGIFVPGGTILAGNYDANIYSLGTTLTPWRRLNLSTTFSYNNSRTVSGINGRAGVVPYQGDTFSVLSSANFVVSQSTDWTLSYSFAHADYRQGNTEQSLPLGIDFDRHGLLAGITRRFGKKTVAGLQYGFFYYEEPTAGGARDYTAHGVFASLKMVFD